MDLLRASKDGMTSVELADQITRDKGWDVQDKRFRVALTDKITRALGKIRLQKRVRSEKHDGDVVWRLAE
jgi:hypothetical protein